MAPEGARPGAAPTVQPAAAPPPEGAAGGGTGAAAEEVDAVVVGAGWTGLATAAALRAYGVRSFVLLEAGLGVGAFWEGNYDRIRLHTPWHGLPCDGGRALYSYPMFKPKRQVVQYLQDYFELHGLQPHARFGERVNRIAQQRPGCWLVDTDAAWGPHRYRCRFVAVCTSKLRLPHLPELPGRERFRGRVLHSREYRTGEAFRGQDVLVVGSGNSAAEICADLVERGAGAVTMLVYGPRLFIPLPRLGLAAWLNRLRGMLNEELAFRAWALRFGTKAFGRAVKAGDARSASLAVDMSSHGIDTPELGFSEANIKFGRIGTFDQGAIGMIRSGRVSVRKARLDSLEEAEVRLADGSALRADAVVLATGFRPGLEDFLAEPERFLRSGQEGKGCGIAFLTPVTDGRGRSTVDDSLFFVGFDQAVNGGLAMGFWGWSCGFQIAQGLGLLDASREFSLEALPERQRDVVRRHLAQRALLGVAVAGVLAAGTIALRGGRSKL